MLRHLSRVLELSCKTVSQRSLFTSFSWTGKKDIELTEKRILRESEALSLLVKNEVVRVHLSPHLSKSILKNFPTSSKEPVEVKSFLVKNLLSQENVTIKVIEDDGFVPVVQVEPIQDASGSATNTVSSSKRGKLLKLRANIDDHMMNIKVRQASELIAKGHGVTVIVRLPIQQLRHLTASSALSDQQKLSLKEDFYKSVTKRFMDAFKSCGAKTPKVIPGNDLREFTIVLRC